MTIIILALTIFLTSCGSIEPQRFYDISFQFNRCRVSCFDLKEVRNIELNYCFSEEEIRNHYDGSQLSYPIEECDGIAGFKLEDWAINIIPWARHDARSNADKKKASTADNFINHLIED